MDELSSQILQIFKNAGYRGKKRGKYLYGTSETTAYKKVIKELLTDSLVKEAEALGSVPLAKEFYRAQDSTKIKEALDSLKVGQSPEGGQIPKELSDSRTGEVGDMCRRFTVIRTIFPSVYGETLERKYGYYVHFYDPVAKEMINPDSLSIDAVLLQRGQDADYVRNAEEAEIPIFSPGFNPGTSQLIYKEPDDSGELVTKLNFFKGPYYLSLIEDNEDEVVGGVRGFFKTFFESLFPEELDREYVYDWIHHAVFGQRAQTILYLAGPQGTGKSLLATDILGTMVGGKYWIKSGYHKFTSQFNSEDTISRIEFFDECAIDTEEILNQLKSDTNDTRVIEGKGKDRKNIRNFKSIIVATNNTDNVAFTSRDRRISAPLTGSVNLKNIINEDEISSFKQSLINKDVTDPIFLEFLSFAKMIRDREPKNSTTDPLKGTHYHNLVLRSLAKWQRHLIETIISTHRPGRLFNLGAVFPGTSTVKTSAPQSAQTYRDFISEFVYKGEMKLGELIDIKVCGDAPLNSPYKPKGQFNIGYHLIVNEEFEKKYCHNYGKVDEEEDRPNPTHLPIQQYHDPGPVKKPKIIGLHDEDNAEDLL